MSFSSITKSMREYISPEMAKMAIAVTKAVQLKTGKKRVVKKLLVKEWLLRGYTITAKQCSRLFGADRASSIIYDLRNEGMSIDSSLINGIDRYKNKVEYSVYRWLGETPKIGFDHKSKSSGVVIYSFLHNFPMGAAAIKTHIRNYVITRLKCKKISKMGFLKGKKGVPQRVLVTTAKGIKIFEIKYLAK